MSTIPAVTVTVRTATTADASRLADTLAEAFQSDPVMSWCYPDDHRRAVLLPASFRVVLDATIPAGGVETVTDEIAGSIWVPPNAAVDEETMAGRLGDISAEYAERLLTLLELLDAHHPVSTEHQYLFVLGTRSTWQSRGLGSALLRSVLNDCDAVGMPAYLEATSERNRSLYARHGFEVTAVVHLPDGPPLWCMWRAPRAA